MIQEFFNTLRQFSFVSVLVRLSLATLCGGCIGYGRTRKSRAAGLRTYMLISLGASLSVLMAIYEYEMIGGAWAPIVNTVGMKLDAGRYASQVLAGIGFLGAGTIMAAPHFQVSGLSTATGLIAAASMGMAAGAGFFECVIIVMVLVIAVLELALPLESAYKRRRRNLSVYVEFYTMDDMTVISEVIRERDAVIYSIDLETTGEEPGTVPAAVFDMRMGEHQASHSGMLSSIAELSCVRSVKELVA